MFYSFFIGTAGCGKSTLTDAFAHWLRDHELDVATVNLDPGAIWLPYAPDVDVRDYINVEDVMRRYNLGPNGALIACADMIVNHIPSLIEEIEELDPEYVLVDTTGQMELFAFRSSGPIITSTLSGERTAVVYMVDALFSHKPSSFVSALLLAASTQYRFLKPQINILAKSDLMASEDLERLMQWIEEPESLIEAIGMESKGPEKEVGERLCQILSELKILTELIPVSAKAGEGLDELYAGLQRIYAGGEDYLTYP